MKKKEDETSSSTQVFTYMNQSHNSLQISKKKMQVSNSQANKNQKSNSIPRVMENNKNLKCTNFECKFSVIKASGKSEKKYNIEPLPSFTH